MVNVLGAEYFSIKYKNGENFFFEKWQSGTVQELQSEMLN